jgi:hypothetical protein
LDRQENVLAGILKKKFSEPWSFSLRINPNAISYNLIAQINANFVYFTKNAPHLNKKW